MARREYVVVIPSRRRSANMPHMLRFFPKAHVYVDEAEKAEYAGVVPKKQLKTHPSLEGQQRIMAYARGRESAETILYCDDDLEYVVSLVETYPRRHRASRYDSPEFVQLLVRNGVNMLHDLDLHLYGWNMQPHPMAYTNCEPLALARLVQGAFLIRGDDVIRVDPNLEHFDADVNLQAGLRDRVWIKDNRFFWSFGLSMGNQGGAQTTMTSERWEEERRLMKRKWGRYFSCGEGSISGKVQGKAQHQESFGVNVPRRSPLAVLK